LSILPQEIAVKRDYIVGAKNKNIW